MPPVLHMNLLSYKGEHLIMSLKGAGLVRDLNPGPLAPKARIIPLDQQATCNIKQMVISIKSVHLFLFCCQPIYVIR